MFRKLTKPASRVSQRIVIIGILFALVAASGIALLLTRGTDADATIEPYAARIDRVDGSVGITRVDEQDVTYGEKEPDWAEATINTPVSVGDRIYSRNGSNASIALTGHNYVRLNPDTSLDVLSLADRRTHLALRGGSALFDVGSLAPEDFYEVATPYGAVDFVEPGLYQIGIDGDNTIISVLSGLAQVVGLAGSGTISKGEVLTLIGATAAQALASRLAPSLAGGIVDDYYADRYPDVYDGRYESYDRYLEDPFYYDPYRSSESCRYVPADIAGVYDLDYYGDWQDIDGYGRCWTPRVSAGWAPFRQGRWDFDPLWGPTWVSREPWGWAPYHYGRWAYTSDRWFWVPGQVTASAYCPAPVAFIPLERSQIAWVPLAPGEVYAPRYYDAQLNPRYLVSHDVIEQVSVQRTFVNLHTPSALTVVPVESLAHGIDPRLIARVDPKVVAWNHHAIDPFAIEGVRQLAIDRKDARRRLRLTRFEQESLNRPVVTNSAVEAFPARADVSKAFQVEQVSKAGKKNKLKIEQTGPIVSTRQTDGLPLPPRSVQSSVAANSSFREQQLAALAARAEQGDKSARREMRRLMRQGNQASPAQAPGNPQSSAAATQREELHWKKKEQRRHQEAVAAQQRAAQQAQQQMLQQQNQQRRLERRQQKQQQRQMPQQPQFEHQRRQEQANQAAQQEAVRRAQQQQVLQQQNQQRRLERQQQKQQRQQLQIEHSRRQQQAGQAAQQEAIRRAQQQQVLQQQNQQRRLDRQQQKEAVRQAQVVQQQRQHKAQRAAEQQRQQHINQQRAEPPNKRSKRNM